MFSFKTRLSPRVFTLLVKLVDFSSALPTMDLKNLTFSHQFPYFASPPRNKVVSRFSLGIVFSLIVLGVLLFNISFKTPLLSPVVHGLHRFDSHNNGTFFSSSSALNDTSACNSSSIVPNLAYPVGLRDTLEPNALRSNQTRCFFGKDEGFGGAHVGTGSEKLKNVSFIVGEGRDGSQTNKNFIFANSAGRGMELQNGHSIDSSENVKNKSISAKEKTTEGKIIGEDSGGNSIVDAVEENGQPNEASKDENVGNHAYLNSVVSSYRECDVFHGRWVRDDTKPYYPPDSCPYVDKDFDCLFNGRPDDTFEKWKWQPYGCKIPSFNATDFLERLRGKKLVFVGDSLNRNMWESLVCLLHHSIPDKNRVYEISGRSEFKKKGFYAFRFEDYNCSLDFVSSPFFVKESYFHGKNGSFETLRLDLMDETTAMYHDADVIVFNTGHWWTHEKTSRGENYYQEGSFVHPRLKVMEAYKRALVTWARWVDSNIDERRTQVVFRGFSVTHFRGGPWNSGGQCHKEIEPIFDKTHLAKYPAKMKIFERALQGMRTPVIYLNISRLTDYRKDGHPSIYRPDYQAAKQDSHVQDCSHWCLPGVPDTWNELLYVSLLKSGRGSWRG